VFTARYAESLKNSTFCPHSVFMCFVWISEQTAIISLYSINWLVFITETECVYCAVRAEYLNVTLVSEWHCDRFLSQYFSLHLSVPFHQCSVLIFVCVLLSPEGQTGEAWEPSKKPCTFGNRGAMDRKCSRCLFLKSEGVSRCVAAVAGGMLIRRFASFQHSVCCAIQFSLHTSIPSSDLGSAESYCEQVTSAVQSLQIRLRK
jgi:hypothetical protein